MYILILYKVSGKKIEMPKMMVERKNIVRTLRKDTLLKEVGNRPVYLYGAGYTAKVCLGALESEGVTIEALIDDDIMKQGTTVLSYPVLSYEEFANKCEAEEGVNVILTSIYGKQIYNRLTDFPNVTVWEMYEWYTELLNQQEIVTEKYCEGEKLALYKQNTDALKAYLADAESGKVLDGIYRYFETRDIRHLVDICTTEESYFIHEVKEYFGNREISLIDAGAYEGELLRAIHASGIKVKNWYCFELEKSNFKRLKDNVEKMELPDGFNCICENLGLWEERKAFPVVAQGTGSKVQEGNMEGGEICQVETIDHYFQDIHVDMIKMDIEGAEMKALFGGINIIRRDKPLLAISIYHYVEDYYRIMQFLLKNAGGRYKYYIRQHALIYGETVLYAIPES